MTLRPGTARRGRPVRLRGIGHIASGWQIVDLMMVVVVAVVLLAVAVAAEEIRMGRERNARM